jgi:dihydrolipoamide dehydrogenase
MNYDAIVIGAGPAGYVASIRLAQLGLKTALVEKRHFGGECTNYGCIPTKALIESANLFWKAKRGGEIGVVCEPKYDLKAFMVWKDKIVTQLRSGIGFLCERNGVKVFEGEAFLKSEKNVVVKSANDTVELFAENIVVATGSTPVQLPSIPFDGKFVLSSKDMFSLESLPNSILIVGGGAIGVEFASALSKLGVQVYLVEMMEQLLPGFDKDVARILNRALSRLGVKIYTGTLLSNYHILDGSLEVRVSGPGGEETFRVEKALVAAGRKPTTLSGLTEAGVVLDSKGHIIVDKMMKSSVPNIFAAGDVAGPPYLAHKAFKQGLVAAENLAGKNVLYNFRAVPNVVFSEPEVVSVGLSEDEARRNGLEVLVGRFPMQASGRALTEASPEGFVKVVVEKDSLKVVGVQIVGANVSELAGEASLAVELGLNVRELASTMHPHPTLSEALMEAAADSLGESVHVFKRRI